MSEIVNCEYCSDPSHINKYMHYVYLDGESPKWNCERHPDYSRKWVCITNPTWILNMRPINKEEGN